MYEPQMTIKLIGIATSPRATSNSKMMLEESFRYLSERLGDAFDCEILNLREHQITPCLGCPHCGKSKDGAFMPCVQQDDVPKLQQKMLEADGFLVATPVYFGLPSDLFFAFMNRTRLLRHQNFRLANKPVGIITTAGRRGGGGEIAATAAWNVFLRNGCLPVGNGGGTSQYGALGWATKAGTITHDKWGMEQARQVGQRVYSLAKVLRAGLAATEYAFPMEFSDTDGKPDFEIA